MVAIFKVFLNEKMPNLMASIYSASPAKIPGTCILSMVVA